MSDSTLRESRPALRSRMLFDPWICAAAVVICCLLHAASAAVSGTTPRRVTLGGIIDQNTDDTLAFTPDGRTVFFDRSQGSKKTILVSHKVGGHWTQPRVAPFSGHWFDQDPVMAPDGSYLLFDSDRPVKPGAKPLTQDYFVGGEAPGSNIWRVERIHGHWGAPAWLGGVINSDPFVDFPSIAADGTLYFIRWDSVGRIMHIYRSQYEGGRYLRPVRVGLGDPAVSTHDPAVAPDQSFMVFDYGKVKGGLGRLCISFRHGDHWSKPIDLGRTVNKNLPWGSHLAPDGKTIYFTDQAGIEQISIGTWLRRR
jgi:hypothetical protein